jgi:hypothetical protein
MSQGLTHRLTRLHDLLIDLRDANDMVRSLRRNGRSVPHGSISAALSESRRRFGSAQHALWLIGYATMRGSYQPGCFPGDIYKRHVAPTLNAAIYRTARLKTLTQRLLRDPALPDSGYRIGGRCYDSEMLPIPADQLTARLFADDADLVVKADGGAQGNAVWLVERAGLARLLQQVPGSDLVFQQRIRQHEYFDRFTPAGAATLRLTTVRELDGSFSIRAAYWRIPGSKQILMAVRSGYYVAVDHLNGHAVGPGIDEYWGSLVAHPDSSIRFDSIVTPGYATLQELALRLHRHVPQVGCIGWDLMIDRDERPWLLEWNAYSNGISFSEATTGPGFLGLGWEKLAPHARRVRTTPPHAGTTERPTLRD